MAGRQADWWAPVAAICHTHCVCVCVCVVRDGPDALLSPMLFCFVTVVMPWQQSLAGLIARLVTQGVHPGVPGRRCVRDSR